MQVLTVSFSSVFPNLKPLMRIEHGVYIFCFQEEYHVHFQADLWGGPSST